MNQTSEIPILTANRKQIMKMMNCSSSQIDKWILENRLHPLTFLKKNYQIYAMKEVLALLESPKSSDKQTQGK